MYGSCQVVFKWAAGMTCFCLREVFGGGNDAGMRCSVGLAVFPLKRSWLFPWEALGLMAELAELRAVLLSLRRKSGFDQNLLFSPPG